MKICFPYRMVGKYQDDYETMVSGFDEDDCMYKLIKAMDEHGDLVYYSNYNDEDYADGMYVGRDNFIYEY